MAGPTRHESNVGRQSVQLVIEWNGVQLRRVERAGVERVLIIPPDRHAKFLCGDTTAFDNAHTDDSRNKLYVGIMRAQYSVAFWHEGGSVIKGAHVWK